MPPAAAMTVSKCLWANVNILNLEPRFNSQVLFIWEFYVWHILYGVVVFVLTNWLGYIKLHFESFPYAMLNPAAECKSNVNNSLEQKQCVCMVVFDLVPWFYFLMSEQPWLQSPNLFSPTNRYSFLSHCSFLFVLLDKIVFIGLNGEVMAWVSRGKLGYDWKRASVFKSSAWGCC